MGMTRRRNTKHQRDNFIHGKPPAARTMALILLHPARKCKTVKYDRQVGTCQVGGSFPRTALEPGLELSSGVAPLTLDRLKSHRPHQTNEGLPERRLPNPDRRQAIHIPFSLSGLEFTP